MDQRNRCFYDALANDKGLDHKILEDLEKKCHSGSPTSASVIAEFANALGIRVFIYNAKQTEVTEYGNNKNAHVVCLLKNKACDHLEFLFPRPKHHVTMVKQKHTQDEKYGMDVDEQEAAAPRVRCVVWAMWWSVYVCMCVRAWISLVCL
jgi:hypothetical protein